MGTKTEIIKLIDEMPDSLKAEALEFVRKISKKHAINDNVKNLKIFNQLKAIIDEYSNIEDEDDLEIDEIYSSRERNSLDERKINFD